MPPLDNVLVRRAIHHAIQRDRWMRVPLLFRHSIGPNPPELPGFNPNLTGWEYDPAKARALLKQSGLPLPLRTVLWAPQDTENGRVNCEGFQSDFRPHLVGEVRMLKPGARRGRPPHRRSPLRRRDSGRRVRETDVRLRP